MSRFVNYIFHSLMSRLRVNSKDAKPKSCSNLLTPILGKYLSIHPHMEIFFLLFYCNCLTNNTQTMLKLPIVL